MRADSWVLNELPELLVADWREMRIFTEFEMQVAAYKHLRDHFDHERNESWIIRAQPVLREKHKPDIAVFRGDTLLDVVELKCQLDGIREALLDVDEEKFRNMRKAYDLRHAYQIVLYDADCPLSVSSSDKEHWQKNFFTFVGVNVRRNSQGRLRRGYESLRSRWERLRERHRG